MSDSSADKAILTLLDERSEGATICPSEAARSLAGDEEWRGEMQRVHEAVDCLVRSGKVRLSWKGRPLSARSGPYRIALLGKGQP
ncbi:DUF3253 domain-containing protein [Qipengyuania atrilutea]|uniref:DUF3253 domain-containing protein n=1 Tax=Qipengyuania atrilutea TaxID=2744473 RepID=A0A850H7N9_9SPHN|nr:DUF3253 domain-containing protein [Actirhodobacter atriluteus]NVD45813.1 DUF3253 domain-containing protein [Actirhodobacter atriluteus]